MADTHPCLTFVEKLAVKLRFLHLGKDMLSYRRFRVPLFHIRGQRTTERSFLTRSLIHDDSVLDLTAGGNNSIYSDKDVDIDVSAVIPVAPYSTPVKTEFKDSADISTDSHRSRCGRILENPSLFLDCETEALAPSPPYTSSPSTSSGSTTLNLSSYSSLAWWSDLDTGYFYHHGSPEPLGLGVPPWHYATHKRSSSPFISIAIEPPTPEMTPCEVGDEEEDIPPMRFSNVNANAGSWPGDAMVSNGSCSCPPVFWF